MAAKTPNDVSTLREAARHFTRSMRLIRPYRSPLIKAMLLAPASDWWAWQLGRDRGIGGAPRWE